MVQKRKCKEQLPKYKPGDKAGAWTVLEYIGRFPYSTREGRTAPYYRAQCSCGYIDEHRDQYKLTRNAMHCVKCASGYARQQAHEKAKKLAGSMPDSEAQALANSLGCLPGMVIVWD